MKERSGKNKSNVKFQSSKFKKEDSIHNVINHNKKRHSCESRNPEKHWIPGQAWDDNLEKIYVVMYKQKNRKVLTFIL
jgi:hypothetical protein